MPNGSFTDSNGVTRELKVWQGRSFKVAVIVGILAITASTIALGDRFLTTESEGREMRYEFDKHIQWGNGKYEEIAKRLEAIERKQEIIDDKLDAIMLDMGVRLRTDRVRR